MANNNASNVSVGKPKASGAIFVAPKGTEVPKDAVAALSDAYKNIGYASDSGVVNSVSTENESISAWGGDEVLNMRTSRSETFKFTAIETNDVTLKLVYGESNVTVEESGIAVIHNGASLPEQVVVFEIAMSGSRVKRVIVPNAKVTSVGDVSYVDNAAIGYEVTISALPDDQGNTAYEHIAEVS